MISFLLKKIFGTKSARDVKRMIPLVAEIKEIEEQYQKLSDDELKDKTREFKERLQKDEPLDDLMCEAFATVKNACRRLMGQTIVICETEMVWDMIPYDVQLMGAIALHRGGIAEMQTGEGKTLVATMPLYLNALTGKNCQLVTVNDYLARRDAEWMGTIYEFLGLTVGCLQNDMRPEVRREQYACDITYGTNSEFGFDYLRDMGMAQDKEQLVQRDYYYAIIDEVDSILIDEARTPLIISGPVAVSTHQFDTLNPGIRSLYQKQNMLCSRLVKEAREILAQKDNDKTDQEEAITKLLQVKMGMPQHKQLMHTVEDGSVLKRLERAEMMTRSDQNRGLLQEIQEDLYFYIDEKSYEADLTEKGRMELSPDDPEAFVLPDMLTELHEIDNDPDLSDAEKLTRKQEFQENFAVKSERLHNISQLVKAYTLYEKDVNYVVQDNKVMIVDEHTGRLMPGRRFSEGLHQALEAKEDVKIEKETQTLATITIQNYFRMYDKLSGMTGTAETEAREFHEIYKLDVVVIPTNEPCIRTDDNDRIYKTKREKYNAIIDEVEYCHQKGQPVLLGTVSVDVSETLSRMLKRRKIPHNVLNAKNHQHEAEIVARAGQKESVTVATNMAGRGTDIKLGEGVTELGGLRVIASERHDSRRIDRQLRGRCARQGDPGSSCFYVSLEDNLMRLFGSDKIVSIMERIGMQEGEELQHPLLNRSIEKAQKRVEQHHFSMRKRTLDYDDVMNKQREIIYNFRNKALLTEDPRDNLFQIIREEIAIHVEDNIDLTGNTEVPFDRDNLLSWLVSTFPIGYSEKDLETNSESGIPDVEMLIDRLFKRVEEAYEAKAKLEDPELLVWMERNIIMEAVDRLWQDHLYAMDNLRSSIGLQVYAQKDPLIAYKKEAFDMFSELMEEISQEILNNVFRSATSLAAFEQIFASMPQQFTHDEIEQFGGGTETGTEGPPIELQVTFKREMPKVGRNDPCPCGSGKKYKKCCG